MLEKYYVKYFVVLCTMLIARKSWNIYVFQLKNVTFTPVVRPKIDFRKMRIFSRNSTRIKYFYCA